MEKKNKKTPSFIRYAVKANQLQEITVTLLKLMNIALERRLGYEKLLLTFKKIKKINRKTRKIIKKIEEKNKFIEKVCREYRKQESNILAMLFVEHVNAFTFFLSDLLLEIFLKKPTLIGNKEIKLQ